MRRPVATALLGVALTAGALELMGILAYLRREGTLFYTASHGTESTPVRDPVSTDSRYVLHPVLGFIWRPSLPMTAVAPRERLDLLVGSGVEPGWHDLEANNYGFFATEDYPYPAPEGEYVIGLFGGSVGQWLALQGADRLARRLDESGVLGRRRPRILNFSQGGLKQPQQLLALAYFLAAGQRFDFVINLDGFNEVALSGLNATRDIDVTMPSSQHLLPIVALLGGASASDEYLEAVLRLKRARRSVARLTDFMRRNRSAALHLILEWLRRRSALDSWEAAGRVDALSTEVEGTPLYHLNGISLGATETSGETAARRIGEVWMNASLLMARLTEGLRVPYLHVLQPNQYHSVRSFEPLERGIAVDEASRYRSSVVEGYPRLLSLLPGLSEKGVHAVSAVGIFNEIDEPVYSDACCHYNQLGNEILADFVAEHMIALIAESDRRLSGAQEEG